MEGVGARLGRSSSRYGATTVFTGPVRKWKKKWVQVAPRSNPQNAAASHQSSSPSLANGAGNTSSRLVLFRWAPVSKSGKENPNNGENENPNSKDDDPESAATDPSEEPPRRKFRYVPVAALEKQNKDAEENIDDEADTDTNAVEPTSKSDGRDDKLDINDVPMEENQAVETERQDLNVSAFDLSLGLTSREGEQGSDLNMEPAEDD